MHPALAIAFCEYACNT